MTVPRRSRRLRVKRSVEKKRRHEAIAEPRHLRRRPETALSELAALICASSQTKTKKKQHHKQILFITGAGLSVDSGIRPFRSSNSGNDETSGLWTEVIWTTATRAAFRKDPLLWYEQFWNPYFRFDDKSVQPNIGHVAMDLLLEEFPNIKQITQNIDGLQQQPSTGELKRGKQLIEVHGRCGLYKCCPDSSDDDEDESESEGDNEDNRPVVLGHRRKSAQQRNSQRSNKACPYQYQQSLREDQVVPLRKKRHQRSDDSSVPSCPECGNVVMPQALLFDEGYHTHSFYEFERAEDWIASADVICLVGTSCAVQLTRETLRHARDQQIPVFSFNVERISSSALTQGLNITHILGPTSETLPLLLAECRSLRENNGSELYIK